MRKGRKFSRIIPILVLVALLAGLVPLAGAACGSDSEEAPVAAFSATPTSGAPPLSITFTDQSTGEIDSWEWNFGDEATSTEQSPTHDYDAEGTYTVSLTVTGPGGTDTETKTNYIEVGVFTANFTADNTTGTFTAGGDVTIQFTDQSTSAEDITAWEWDFGDGETSTEQNPSHVYAGVVNRYDVSLTVTSAEETKTATKDGYITVQADHYDSANLKLSYPMAPGQTDSKPADKFAELLASYSNGSVDVTVFGGGTLYGYFEDLTAVQNGAVDIIWTHPYFLRALDPCLDPFGGLPCMLITHDMGRYILNNTEVPDIMSALTERPQVLNSKIVGFFETVILGGFFGNYDMGSNFAKDAWTGKRFGTLLPGAMSQELEWSGLEEVYVGGLGEVTAAAQGLYDCTGTALSHFVETGLIDYFDYALITGSFQPMCALFNIDAWNDLPTNTQDLIMNIVVPECEEFAREITLDQTAKDLKTIYETCKKVNIQTPVQQKAVYDDMVAEEYGPMMDVIQDFKDGFDGIGEEIFDIVYAARPAEPEWDTEWLYMLDYAGIPVPPL